MRAGRSGCTAGWRRTIASDPDQAGELFEPAESKIYRHPTFYDIPDEVKHI